MPCAKKHKMFLSYLRVSTKEGLFSEITTTDSDLRYSKYNEDIYRECEWCNQVFKIEIAFKENPFICCSCHKLLKSEDVRDIISPKIILYYIMQKIKYIEFVQIWIDIKQKQFLKKIKRDLYPKKQSISF